MSKRKPLWDILSNQEKRECIEHIIAYFQDERDEKIGVIAAEDLLELILEPIVKTAYNKGVDDAKKTLLESVSNIDLDLDLLRQ
jgi:uncharacterized protein (DUF2164 family)